MQFDREKMRAVVLYACRECPAEDLGATKLHKVLYYLDMIRYASTGKPVTGAVYRKRPFGPTNDRLVGTLRDLEKEGLLTIEDADHYGFTKKRYVALVEPDMSRITKDELSLLDDVIDFVCRKNSAKTISKYSHNQAWQMADFGDEIPYRTAYLLYPSEVSSEAFDWAEQEFKGLEAERSTGPMEAVDFAVFRGRIQQGIRAL